MNTRREFLRATVKSGIGAALAPLAASSLGAQTAPQEMPGKRPNILVLFPDQWRFDWMSTNRQLPIRTPNIDRLARMGARFTNTVVASPLCAPSRACLAAGVFYGKTGVANNAQDFPYSQVKTFYTMLRDSGYHVLGCGKMDLAKASLWWGVDGKWRLPSLGFSDGINNAGKIDQVLGYRLNNNKPADPYISFLNDRGLLPQHMNDYDRRIKDGYAATFPTPLPDDAYCDNWLAQNGLDLLNAAPKDKPWFLQVNFTGPHDPEDITRRMESTVRGLAMPQPNGANRYSAEVNHTIRQNYTAMCENIDRTIGLYLDWLESSGQMQNTLIVFSSDHGEMLGDHSRWGKIVPYHPSASVPLIVAGPGVARNSKSEALVSHIDLTATYLDYAGVPRPAAMDSKSLRPILEQRATTKHRDVLFSALGAWRMAFDGEYKAITGFDPKLERNAPDWTTNSPQVRHAPPMVFDLADDSGENKDIYTSHTSSGERLLQILAEQTQAEAHT